MEFPIDGDDWRLLNDQQTRDIVSTLNQLLPLGDSSAHGPLVYEQDAAPDSDADAELRVSQAWCRPLLFYPSGWFLYRVACVIDEVADLDGYERHAFAFAICGPTAERDRCTLIDWTSEPIHRLNKQLGLDLSVLHSDALRQYLIFFCSFLGGQHDTRGEIWPFLLPSHADTLTWDEDLEELEVVARKARLQLFAPMADANREDMFDLPETDASLVREQQHPDQRETAQRLGQTIASKRQAVEAAFSAHPGTPVRVSGSDSDETERQPAAKIAAPEARLGNDDVPTSPGIDTVATFEALVWYGDTLFFAVFRVARTGEIGMVKDEPVAGAMRLPVPRWEVQQAPGSLWLLCRQLKREVISASELLERIEGAVASPSGPMSAQNPKIRRLRGLRVRDRLECSTQFKGAVKLHDVEFAHDVVLDDAVFERSLELLGCRFLRRLSACDATIKGAMRLDGCRIDGAIKRSPPSRFDSLGRTRAPPVLDLRGLKIERGLFADRVTVFGRMRAEWIRIGGALRARGLQIHPRRDAPDAEHPALDLSHAQIDGPLDLRGFVTNRREPGGQQRTMLGGGAILRGLHADQVDFSGMHVEGDLDLASCDVKGRLLLDVVSLGTSQTWWRTSINGDLSLDRARIRLVSMDGCAVAGDLHLIELQLSGSLFGELTHGFRTRISGNFVGSGAAIEGSIELRGADVGGEIQFITGRFGRLSAAVGVWVGTDAHSTALLPHLCPCEASGVLLQDVSGVSVYLIGIRLHGRRHTYTEGGMTARGLRLEGELSFWRGPVSINLMRQSMMREANLHATTEHIEKAIASIHADINGSLDLRGISTGDDVDLSRLRVGKQVRLDNARIDGNLRAYAEGELAFCSVGALSADIATIRGNVDLRGLKVRESNLTGRDIQVNGQLLLATPPDLGALPHANGATPGPHAIVAKGRLDLDGAKAARLVLTGNTVLPNAHTGQEAAIVLSRGQFGQLTIMGFEDQNPAASNSQKRFPHAISLLAIDVGDWDIDPITEALPLLEATAPNWFDGRNFVDIEQRLAKIGRKPKADQVYRAMLLHSARGRGARFWNWLNKWFSGNGTKPLWMAGWLVVFLVPVVMILANPANVEFVRDNSGKEVRPVSDGRSYDLDRDWDWIKATGLASAYALPFLAGSRFDVVRPRLVGATCIDFFSFGARQHTSTSGPTVPASGDSKERSVLMNRPLPVADRCKSMSVDVSPHSLAMMFASFQFILWILVAANLPAITRRRP